MVIMYKQGYQILWNYYIIYVGLQLPGCNMTSPIKTGVLCTFVSNQSVLLTTSKSTGRWTANKQE